jgi:hypothetical protein
VDFREWLEGQGCQVEVTQGDDGGGYEVWEVRVPVWQADQGSSAMSDVVTMTVTL